MNWIKRAQEEIKKRYESPRWRDEEAHRALFFYFADFDLKELYNEIGKHFDLEEFYKQMKKSHNKYSIVELFMNKLSYRQKIDYLNNIDLSEYIEDTDSFIPEDPKKEISIGDYHYSITFSHPFEYEDEDSFDEWANELNIDIDGYGIDYDSSSIYFKNNNDAKKFLKKLQKEYSHWRDFYFTFTDLNTGTEEKIHTPG